MINRKIKKKVLAIALSSTFLFTSSSILLTSLAIDTAQAEVGTSEQVDSTDKEKETVKEVEINNQVNATTGAVQGTSFNFKDNFAEVTLDKYKVDSKGNGYLLVDIKNDFVKGSSNKYFSKDDKAMTISTNFSGDNETLIENSLSSYKASTTGYTRFYIPYNHRGKDTDKLIVKFEIPSSVQDKLNTIISEADGKSKEEAVKNTEMKAMFFSELISDEDLISRPENNKLEYDKDTPVSGFVELDTYIHNLEEEKIYKGFVFDESNKVIRIKPKTTKANKIKLYLGANSNGFSYNSSFGDIEVKYYNNGSTYRKVMNGDTDGLKSDQYKKATLAVSSGFSSVELPSKNTDEIIEIRMNNPNNILLNLKLEAYPNINVDSGSSDTTDKPSTDDSINASVHRISGSDRYSTAIDLSKKAFDEADTAVIASGQNFADALSGGALAAINKAPLLLVDNTSSTVDKVNKELRRLGVKKVYILGGKNSISINTEMKISNDKDSDDKSRTVERIDGSDRYETSYKIYKEVARSQSGKEEVILVNGTEFADALSAGPLAAYTNRAIVLTDGKNLVSGLDKNNDKNIIIGGLSSMDSSFKGRRISGSDRYETSVKVAQELGSVDNVMLASGETYPDGLASISLYNKYKAPLLLSQRYSLPSATKRYINDKSVKDIYIVGGTNSISTKVEDIFK